MDFQTQIASINKPMKTTYTKQQKEILLNFGKLLSETPYFTKADPATGLNEFCTLLVTHLRTRKLGAVMSFADYGYFLDQPESRAKLLEGMRYIQMSNSEKYPHLPKCRLRIIKDEYGNEEFSIESTV